MLKIFRLSLHSASIIIRYAVTVAILLVAIAVQLCKHI